LTSPGARGVCLPIFLHGRFGNRRIGFGEGALINSPASVSTILSLQAPSEDDVLHADKLPAFGGTLSREEAEALMSYLTVDYIRLPLVMGFFASSDRLTYLFNRELQVGPRIRLSP
jgi:hypothetical protein